MKMVEIHPAVVVWLLLLTNWLGNCSAYVDGDASRRYAEVTGIVLLLTGILMFGISIGGA